MSSTSRSGKPTHSYTDKDRGPRLQKVMADAGIASRRECEQLIEEGHVTINGERIKQLPCWVNPQEDRIEVDGQPIRKPRKGDRLTYVILHKPKNIISSAKDDLGRTSVTDLVEVPGARLFPVGRLDADSTGLILLTNDGQLTQALTHPSYEVSKTYEVAVKGLLDQDDLAKMKKGMFLGPNDDPRPGKTGRDASRPQTRHTSRQEGPRLRGQRRASVDEVTIINHQIDRSRGDQTNLLITLSEGQNREIRRLLARLGYKVKRLKRTAIGPLKLKGLGTGQWRLLSKAEVDQLYKSANLTPLPNPEKGQSKSAHSHGHTHAPGARAFEHESAVAAETATQTATQTAPHSTSPTPSNTHSSAPSGWHQPKATAPEHTPDAPAPTYIEQDQSPSTQRPAKPRKSKTGPRPTDKRRKK